MLTNVNKTTIKTQLVENKNIYFTFKIKNIKNW